jgi:hypothetical protein
MKRGNTMNNIGKSTLALGLVVAAAVLTSTAEAEIHSMSKELVVMEARDLPEQAQTLGNSLFLHSDNAGRTYLYVEQQQGARLSVFNVTDPARIKLVVSTPLAAEGAFDLFVPSATMPNSCIFAAVRRKPCSIYARPKGLCFGQSRL